MNLLNYILPPLIGGIIALSTNWLAIKMLFRPHKAKYIFGWRIPFTPGLIPKERAQLSKKLAIAISTRLLTPEVLTQGLSDPAGWPLPDITIGELAANLGISDPTAPIAKQIKQITEKLLPKALDILPNIAETHPEIDAKLAELTYKIIDENIGTLASMFISKEKIYTSIKSNLLAYLTNPENHDFILEKLCAGTDYMLTHPDTKNTINEKLFTINIREGITSLLQNREVTHFLELATSYIAKNMPIQTMIENKMNEFDAAEAEDVVLSVAGRELRMIILLGGVLGIIIGGIMVIF